MVQDVAQAQAEISPIRRILVPVEGSDREFIVQEHAMALAAALGISVHAVHVRAPIDHHDEPFMWLKKESDQWGVDLVCREIDGTDPAAEILEEIEPLDLVIIGSSHAGSKYSLGSVAEQLVRRAPCPVQIVRLPS